jgi:hypothetical protein
MKQTIWHNVKDKPIPIGFSLVYMAGAPRGPIQVCNHHANVTIVGGLFAFDQPTITHWTELPEPPNIT